MNAAPLTLGSSLAITRGQSLQFSARDLAPKVTVPYEVNAIRMLAYAAAPLNATGEPGIAPDSSLRGFLRFQFTLGPIPLTDHFIPMWNLCPIRQAITEFGGYFEWRFSRPLVISPAGRIDARVQLDASTPNAGGAPTITTKIAYSGRLRPDLSKLPDMVDVPFVSCWDTTLTGTNLANDGISLRNPLARAVDIEQLICRVEDQTNGLDGDDSTEIDIRDPWGHPLSRFGPIQIHAMFPAATRSFPYYGQLPSEKHFWAKLNTAPSGTYKPMISYLGSRRERSL
jgi:hypothetical protein